MTGLCLRLSVLAEPSPEPGLGGAVRPAGRRFQNGEPPVRRLRHADTCFEREGPRAFTASSFTTAARRKCEQQRIWKGQPWCRKKASRSAPHECDQASCTAMWCYLLAGRDFGLSLLFSLPVQACIRPRRGLRWVCADYQGEALRLHVNPETLNRQAKDVVSPLSVSLPAAMRAEAATCPHKFPRFRP